MIYTSGTTGKPKGVICNHVSPVNMIDLDNGFCHGTPGVDILGCSAPVIFDVFVEGFFGSLGSGLAFSLDLKNCTVLVCTPSVAPLLLADETNSMIIHLLVGGEVCPLSWKNVVIISEMVMVPLKHHFIQLEVKLRQQSVGLFPMYCVTWYIPTMASSVLLVCQESYGSAEQV